MSKTPRGILSGVPDVAVLIVVPELNVLRKTEIVSTVVRLVTSKLFVTTEIPDHTSVVQRRNVPLLLIDHLDTTRTPTTKIFEKIPPKEEMKSASIKVQL